MLMRQLAICTLIVCSALAWAFTGTVVDASGHPVAGARVSIWTFWTSPRTFHADNNGLARVVNVTAADGTVYSTYVKIIDARGKPVSGAIVVIPGSNDAPFTRYTDAAGHFDFAIPGEWDGAYRVMDRAGTPMPHAQILRGDDGRHWSDMKTTDDAGAYRVPEWESDGKEQKELGINVIAKGYAFASLSVNALKDRSAVITVHPEKICSARIVDEHSMPVRGAKVVMDEAQGELKDGARFYLAGFDMPSSGVKSGTDGRVTLRHLPDETTVTTTDIVLSVSAPGRARIERKHYTLADLRKADAIILPRACRIVGTLLPPAGGQNTGDLGLKVTITDGSKPQNEEVRYISVAKNGTFRFDNLPPGEAAIELTTVRRRTLDWVLPAVQHLRLVAGEVKHLQLNGVVGAVISGTVRDAATGKPLPGAALTIEDAGYPGGNWWVSGDDGTYTLRVAPGAVRVYVSFIFVGDTRIEFDRAHGVTREVADGQTITGVDVAVNVPAK